MSVKDLVIGVKLLLFEDILDMIIDRINVDIKRVLYQCEPNTSLDKVCCTKAFSDSPALRAS